MLIEVEVHGQERPDIIKTEKYDIEETYKILNGIKKNEVGNTYNNILLGQNIYSCVSVKSIKILENIE
ncbi:hypothetical protein CM318V1_280023 [Carnobacterium maltaromaticum]|uniref:hypothetical protein n=1 Tax=Carnobacterium TaxID=2747 RepID=UPI0007052B50|nr:hypothetical protein [Carnobacterium maltaromaticum]KRN71356.1 hypothetical protein IV76_GL000856 [Carnobacterium maltaromaticum]CRH18742.1 hypothetical protein CM318V1_280023 [Carnobacterium maltaromaticum]